MTAISYNWTGEQGEKTALPKNRFEVKVAPELLAQAVRVYLQNQRKAAAKTKTRAEVEGSTRKIFRQKGTGRARHGSIRAPIFVGGGISHGPDGEQNYALKMTKPMTQKALAGALSEKYAEGKVVVLQEAKTQPKTKDAFKLKNQLGVKSGIMVVTGQKESADQRAWRNLAGVSMTTVNALNTYDVLKAKLIVITNQGLEELK